MKGLMGVMGQTAESDGDGDSMAAESLEGGPVGQPSEEQISVAGEVMSAMQNNDMDGFAEALASFVEMSK